MSLAPALLAAWPPVLFAADWSFIIWLVVIGIGILNQLLGGDKKKKQPPKPVAKPQAGGNNPQGGAKGLLDEVERFLQEARKATEKAQNRPPQQQVPTPQVLEQRRVRNQQKAAQRAASKQKQQQKSQPAKRGETRSLSGLSDRHLQSKLELSAEEETFRGTVAEHVAENLDTHRFDERAGRLSHLQSTVEQDIGGHVRSVFDHQVGTLTDKPTVQTAAVVATTAGPAEQIVAMLRDPQSMRNAVILQEILRPATDRW